MMTKKQKIKKLLNKLDPKPKVEIKEVVKVVEKIVEKPVKQASNLPFLFALTKKFLTQKKAVGKVKDEIKSVQKDLEDKIDSVEKKIPEIPEVTKVDLAPLEKDIEEIKEKIKKEKLDVLNRLADHGGGNMNRQILVNSSVISTKYTDINFLQGANATFTTQDDNTNKRVNFTIQGTDTDTGITQLIGDVEAGPGNGSVVATLASIIAAGTHGSATTVPVVTNDVKGRITAISSVAVAYPSVPAGVTSVVAGGGIVVSNANPSTPIVERSSIVGDISIPQGSVIATLASVLASGGPVGGASAIPTITWDTKGRLTAVSSVAVAIQSIAAAGASGNVQYNNTGSTFGASSGFSWDKNTSVLSVNNIVTSLITVPSILGGTGAGNNLLLNSTSNATKGYIGMGNSVTGVVYNETANRLTVGGITPTAFFDPGGAQRTLFYAFDGGDTQPAIGVENTSSVGTSAAALIRTASDAARINFQSHGSARVISRWGVTLGGWNELIGVTGNGFAFGTSAALDVIIGTAAINRFHLDETADETVFNQTGANWDFRVEGDNLSHLVFADAGTDNVGINTSVFGTSAKAVLAIGSGTEPTAASQAVVQIYSASVAGGATFGVRTEASVISSTVGGATNYLNVRINGTTYKLLLQA